MRNWLSWIVGFVLCFGGFSLLLLVYSLNEPSMWLPILFGIAFYGLLSLSPRIGPRRRMGIAIVFGSVSSLLWAASSSLPLTGGRSAVQLAFEVLLAVFALIGLLVALGGEAQTSKSAFSLTPVLGLMLLGWLISYFSSTHGGASPMVDWVIRNLGFGRHTAELFVVGLRKTIHFTFYGVVALTGLATAIRNGAARNTAVVAALMTTLAYASFDEIRQSTQADRTGSAWDVLLDMAGGSGALILVTALAPKKTAGIPTRSRKSSKI